MGRKMFGMTAEEYADSLNRLAEAEAVLQHQLAELFLLLRQQVGLPQR